MFLYFKLYCHNNRLVNRVANSYGYDNMETTQPNMSMYFTPGTPTKPLPPVPRQLIGRQKIMLQHKPVTKIRKFLFLLPMINIILAFIGQYVCHSKVLDIKQDQVNIFMILSCSSLFTCTIYFLLKKHKDMSVFLVIVLLSIFYNYFCLLNVFDINTEFTDNIVILMVMLTIVFGLDNIPNVVKMILYTIIGVVTLFAIMHITKDIEQIKKLTNGVSFTTFMTLDNHNNTNKSSNNKS